MNNVDSITVRMYNTGSVGDCILLLFKKANVVSFTMLIDCGGYQTKTASIQACVNDIRQQIVNDTIDLVVVTHEHLDHVSGFNQVRSIYDKLKFKQVWMSWAEDVTDPVAIKLKKEKGKKIAAISRLVEKNFKQLKRRAVAPNAYPRLKRSLGLRRDNRDETLTVLEFEEGLLRIGNTLSALKTGDAMKYVISKSIVKAKSKMFKDPGDVIEDLPGAEGVRFHILAPPKEMDLSSIKILTKAEEMYSLRRNLNDLGATLLSNIDKHNDLVLQSPFHAKYKMNKRSNKEDMVAFESYYSKNKWRQIEDDWLDMTEELAIAVNSYTNNTSLAFAIEMPGGKVLLFPADAQSGNWMSWHKEEVRKRLVQNGGKTAKHLLKKTVFYKVGHHGSHNGTASISGLDNMTSNKLVAFIPLVQAKVPKAWGGSKNFPAHALYTKLIEVTNGAVVRTDTGLIKDGGADSRRDKHLPAATIKALKKIKAGDLCHEWVVK